MFIMRPRTTRKSIEAKRLRNKASFSNLLKVDWGEVDRDAVGRYVRYHIKRYRTGVRSRRHLALRRPKWWGLYCPLK
jgi:hypothetical protein